MKNIFTSKGFYAAVVILLAIAYGATHVSLPGSKDYKVGVILPLSGIAASFGEEVRAGIEASGIASEKLIIEDDGCDPKKAVSAFLKLASDPSVAYIIGPACGSPQEAIAPMLKDKSILVFLPAAASADLFETSGGKMYDVQYSLEKEGAALAEKVYADGHKNVAVIEYKNSFSQVSSDAFKKAYVQEEGTRVAYTAMLTDTNSDIKTELLKIKNAKPDAIFAADISFFLAGGVKNMRELGMSMPVYAQYPIELPAIRTLVEGVTYSYPELAGDRGALFEMGKVAAETVRDVASACGGSLECAQSKIKATNMFDEEGVSNRAVIFKKIEGGEAKPI